jgi:nicotinate phosphoribosyltransferase
MKTPSTGFSLLTDLYELTMAACYYREKMFGPATFSLFIRKYPPGRGYLVSAGLEDVLDFLEGFSFSPEDLDYLAGTEMFAESFLDYLGSLRFTGDVVALPEGSLFFRDEPILEVTAPIAEAQLVETYIINQINLQVSLATKAARCVHAAGGRNLLDFSLRRTQGTDAGNKVARAAYLAGFGATSNVLAGKLYDIPISGTMAHSFVTSFEEEIDSFRVFAETFPEKTVLLIDTYDTISGARKAAQVAREMAGRGQKLAGVRLDSGDMAELSKEVRRILHEEGVGDVKIFASGAFDEYKIADVLERGGEIDGFGVGTKLGVSADAPYTDMAYKLVQYDGRPVLKLSSGKKTLVSEKQVFQNRRDGKRVGDLIGLREERQEGEPALVQVMKGGRRVEPQESLFEARERFREAFAALDDSHKDLQEPAEFPVGLSEELQRLQRKVIQETREKELGES